jgi:hypothetical protein
MKRPRLNSLEILDNFKMRLSFIDSSMYTIDFDPLFKESPGLAPLADRASFASAVVGEKGWIVEWPDLDIQIGADTLLLDARAQNATDENSRVFAEWRAKNGLSLSAAACALGITTRTVSSYSNGARPVPRTVALACKGWECEHIH